MRAACLDPKHELLARQLHRAANKTLRRAEAAVPQHSSRSA
jgi:hypothetical protein